MGRDIELPTIVRNKAIAADAAWWIDAIGDIVADLEREWSITVGRALAGRLVCGVDRDLNRSCHHGIFA